MRVILQKDVKNLGRKNEIKKVADGYARHFLIAKKLAVMATPDLIKMVEYKQKIKKSKIDSQHRRINSLADRLAAKKIKMASKASANGTLFGSVSARQIAQIIKNEFNIQISADNIIINKSIKTIGEHQILIKLPDHITIKMSIIVSSK